MTAPALGRGPAGRATLVVALSACGFASIPIFVTLATRSGTPLIDVLVGRYGMAAILLAIIAWAAGTRSVGRAGFRVLIVAGILQALIAYVSLLALQYITAGTLSFLFYTYPAWIAIIARVRHSEPLTRPRLIALALSLAGVLVMVGSPAAASLHPTGVALAFASAILYAVYIPLLGEMQRGLTPPTTAACMATGAAIVFLLSKIFGGAPAFHFTTQGIESAAGLAVVSTTISFMLFLRGLATLGPVRTAIISTIEPFCTAILGAWFLSQPLTKETLFGGALIAAAVILLTLRSTADASRGNSD